MERKRTALTCTSNLISCPRQFGNIAKLKIVWYHKNTIRSFTYWYIMIIFIHSRQHSSSAICCQPLAKQMANIQAAVRLTTGKNSIVIVWAPPLYEWA